MQVSAYCSYVLPKAIKILAAEQLKLAESQELTGKLTGDHVGSM